MTTPFRRRYEHKVASRHQVGPKIPQDDSGTAAIARINELTHAARPVWFMLLGYLAFALITLLGVDDADFFIESRQTQLPLVNVSIPTSSFFQFAPLLGSALYVYFHLQLFKLWDALSIPDAEIKGRPLSELVTPWLVNDYGLGLRNDGSMRIRALSWLSNFVVGALVFWAGPLTLSYFWIRSFPAHDKITTLIIAIALIVSSVAWFHSRRSARSYLQIRKDYTGCRRGSGDCVLITLLFFLIAGLSWLGTKVSSASMVDEEFVPLPPSFLDYDVHRRRFRVEWCSRQGFSMTICGPYLTLSDKPPSYLDDARIEWW